jgi:hypothetical protein
MKRLALIDPLEEVRNSGEEICVQGFRAMRASPEYAVMLRGLSERRGDPAVGATGTNGLLIIPLPWREGSKGRGKIQSPHPHLNPPPLRGRKKRDAPRLAAGRFTLPRGVVQLAGSVHLSKQLVMAASVMVTVPVVDSLLLV